MAFALIAKDITPIRVVEGPEAKTRNYLVIIEVVPGHCKRTANERSEAKMKAYPGRLRIDLDLCVSDTFAFGLAEGKF